MKLADYVASFISDTLHVKHVFLISGGANLHLINAVDSNPKLTYVCPQHEQGGAFASEAYARVTGGFGVNIVTSGPGGTNTLTGVAAAWMDSVPCLFISGQVNLGQYVDGTSIRQLGVQQINILEIVRSVTKYHALIEDPHTIRYHLEKAAFLAREGRPGPVWLDIPTNVQQVDINPDALVSFDATREYPRLQRPEVDSRTVREIADLIVHARRPLCIGGHGVRIASSQKKFRMFVERFNIPAVLTWNGIDLLPHDHPLYVGRAGFYGQRGAAFAVANADLLVSIGSRLDTKQVGNNSKEWARKAKKVVVDVSLPELQKNLIPIDYPICADAAEFLEAIMPYAPEHLPERQEWNKHCLTWKERYSPVLSEYREEKEYVNSYVFVDMLSDILGEGDVVVTDMGTSLTCTMQSFKVKEGQRLFTNTGLAPMGFGLPGAIGAWFGLGDAYTSRIVCIHGDGGLQMNIQELQTVMHYKIPLKLFVFDNGGYLTIRHTQDAYMGGRLVGSGTTSGVSMPDIERIGIAYGMHVVVIRNHRELQKKIQEVLDFPGAVICRILMNPRQPLIPKIMGRRIGEGVYKDDPVEQMWPYLPQEEFERNMAPFS